MMALAPVAASGRLYALVPCGGSGSRAGAGVPKQYRQLAGNTVLGHTLAAFAGFAAAGYAAEPLAQVVVVVSATQADVDMALQTLNQQPAARTTFTLAACAGATRADTVRNGLVWLLAHGATAQDWVLVHDAARCLITPEQINALVLACRHDAVGGLLAHRLADTLKQESGGNGRVHATLDRADKWLAQTPQMFRIGALCEALAAAAAQAVEITDEASAMEFKGHAPKLVPGSAQNFKLTYPEDFALAQAVLQSRQP